MENFHSDEDKMRLAILLANTNGGNQTGGPMPADWIEGLKKRGIDVQRNVLREEAYQVFLDYQKSKGTHY